MLSIYILGSLYSPGLSVCLGWWWLNSLHAHTYLVKKHIQLFIAVQQFLTSSDEGLTWQILFSCLLCEMGPRCSDLHSWFHIENMEAISLEYFDFYDSHTVKVFSSPLPCWVWDLLLCIILEPKELLFSTCLIIFMCPFSQTGFKKILI